jgi:hypothetical protein
MSRQNYKKHVTHFQNKKLLLLHYISLSNKVRKRQRELELSFQNHQRTSINWKYLRAVLKTMDELKLLWLFLRNTLLPCYLASQQSPIG